MVAALAARPVAAQQATVTGRVTDGNSGQPVAAAQVSVVGTNLSAFTNSDGAYTIRGLTPGPATVRVLRLGYAEQSQEVTIVAGQAATADFAVRPILMTLTPVVVTATGEQRRVELGNAIGQINAPEVVQRGAVSNIADALTSRTPGVMVIPGTQTGAGVRIRIRGTSSLSLSNNPIYFVDGIRVEGTTGSSSVSVGGTTASRVSDLNPEEIGSIEVVRGPSASTLYGTDAANGVIVITTKRGIAGAPRWTFYTEQTAITDRNDYPTAYRGWRNTSTASNTVQCFLTQVVAGTCVQDSVTSYNLHEDPESTPYGVGYRYQYGAQVSGGSETVRYFLHGEWESEDGATKMPEFDRRYLAARDLTLRPEQENPNFLSRATVRANLSIALPKNLDVAVNTGFTTQDLRLPTSDDAGTAGIATNVYGGPGFKYNLTAAGDTLYGWRAFTPRDIYEAVTTQAIERLITSVRADWRPNAWLGLRGTFGVDYTNRYETQLCRFGDCTDTPGPFDLDSDRLGFKIDNRTNFFVYTVDAAASATRRLSDAVQSQTTAGVQFYRNVFTRNGAAGVGLPPGATTVTAGAEVRADETTSETRTLGAFVEERLAFRDRLFVTAAVRSDRNSAFGADFKTVFYPKLSVSWVLSDEPFFPTPSWLDQLRLRTAYGASGVQPGTTDAVQFFSSTRTIGESGDEVSGAVFSTLGNRTLKPERSTEIEVGVDGTLWNGRLSTEVTYYNKASKDALVERVLPPSLGTQATDRVENLGKVRNWGWEARIDAQLLQQASLGWDVSINASSMSNKLVSLGGLPTIITSSALRQQKGYPLNGWWSRRLVSYNDANGDGIISLSEIVVSDTPEFHGYSVPRHEIAMTTGLEFWGRRLRLAAMLDYKGGHKIYNNSERIRCASRFNCSGLINPNSSLFEQARTVMVREHSSRSIAGFFEDGDFIRFRELALTLAAPEEWAAVFRSRSLVATLAVRNLGILWTKYTGVDPEAFGTTGDAPSSFQAFAPPTYYSLRLTLGF